MLMGVPFSWFTGFHSADNAFGVLFTRVLKHPTSSEDGVHSMSFDRPVSFRICVIFLSFL